MFDAIKSTVIGWIEHLVSGRMLTVGVGWLLIHLLHLDSNSANTMAGAIATIVGLVVSFALRKPQTPELAKMKPVPVVQTPTGPMVLAHGETVFRGPLGNVEIKDDDSPKHGKGDK